MEIPGGKKEQYDAVMRNLGLALGQNSTGWPAGIISHTSGPTKTGWRVVDVWESQEYFQKFFDEKLGKAVHDAGLPAFTPDVFEVYNVYVTK